jgi:hypothetical protein
MKKADRKRIRKLLKDPDWEWTFSGIGSSKELEIPSDADVIVLNEEEFKALLKKGRRR